MKYLWLLFLLSSCSVKDNVALSSCYNSGHLCNYDAIDRSSGCDEVCHIDEVDKIMLSSHNEKTLESLLSKRSLGIGNIAAMHDLGMSEETILQYVKNSKLQCPMTHNDILDLENSGLRRSFILEIIENSRL